MRTIYDIFRSYAEFAVMGDGTSRHVGGTDKQSNHNYGDAYESLFIYPETRWQISSPSREDVKLVMEVGVADGACLLAWREVFPNATIVGMDVHPCARAMDQERIEFHLGDQCSQHDCERAAAGRQFDMIVEDATHKLENTLLTMYWLWPYVKPGGIYVVEEWEGAAGNRDRIQAMFPGVNIIGTSGPHIQDEPLIVFRKP